MKTNRMFHRAMALVVGLGLSMAFSPPVSAADTSIGKGAWQLIKANRLKTAEQAQAVEEGDLIVMSCPKCKTVQITRVETEPKGTLARTVTTESHLCPGCKTSFKLTGHGKATKRELVHECSECGSKSAFCCVVKKADLKDGRPTKGMEQRADQ